jgi:hypothetical protein
MDPTSLSVLCLAALFAAAIFMIKRHADALPKKEAEKEATQRQEAEERELKQKEQLQTRSSTEKTMAPLPQKPLEQLIVRMSSMQAQSDSAIRMDGIFRGRAQLTSHWQTFEGNLDEAQTFLKKHLSDGFPEGQYRYDFMDAERFLQLNVNNASRGYPHYVWKTTEGKYILLVPQGAF